MLALVDAGAGRSADLGPDAPAYAAARGELCSPQDAPAPYKPGEVPSAARSRGVQVLPARAAVQRELPAPVLQGARPLLAPQVSPLALPLQEAEPPVCGPRAVLLQSSPPERQSWAAQPQARTHESQKHCSQPAL